MDFLKDVVLFALCTISAAVLFTGSLIMLVGFMSNVVFPALGWKF